MSTIDNSFLNEIRQEQRELITKKEGYEAMLYAIKAYWENSGSNDLTDILSGGEYWKGTDYPADTAFWAYWTEAIEKVKKDGPMFRCFLSDHFVYNEVNTSNKVIPSARTANKSYAP